MKVIRPIAITDSILTSCDVPENDYAAWSEVTAYTAGDRCIVTTTGVHKIYEALVNVTGGDSPEVDVLSKTPKWLEISATNRWKAFDNKVGTQTSKATSMKYTFTPGSRIDSIALLNLDATLAQIVITDPVDGEVYNETIDLINPSTVFDWYTYFVEPIGTLRTDLVATEFPIYAHAVIEITITYTGGTAKVGAIILGRKFELGGLNYSPSIGITDYSTKDVDTWGNLIITERAYSKKMSCDVSVRNIYVDELLRQLSLFRAQPLIWVGDNNYGCTIIYGFYKDFNIVIQYDDYSICNLEIEGLT